MTTVTRFDIRNTSNGNFVRFFNKRKKVGEMKIVGSFFDEDDAWVNKLQEAVDKGNNLDNLMSLISGDIDEEELGDDASMIPTKYRIRYGADQNCGDDIALTLTAFVTTERTKNDGGLDRAKLRGVAEENGIADRLTEWEHRELNGGLLRMNLSNVLRGMRRRGERVVIGNRTWRSKIS